MPAASRPDRAREASTHRDADRQATEPQRQRHEWQESDDDPTHESHRGEGQAEIEAADNAGAHAGFTEFATRKVANGEGNAKYDGW